MANTHTTLESLFTDIANAIRSKTGDTATIVADNFPAAIQNISTAKPTSGVDFGTVTLSARSTTLSISHSLGSVPTNAYVFSKSMYGTYNSLFALDNKSFYEASGDTGGIDYYYNYDTMTATDTTITWTVPFANRWKADTYLWIAFKTNPYA